MQKIVFQSSPIVVICSVVSIACAGVAVTSKASQNLQSARLEESRIKSLEIIVQHITSESCWELTRGTDLKIGDEIFLNGDGTGKAPTSCFISKQKSEYGFASYLNGKLKIVYVFSQKEIDAKRSQLLEKKKQ